MSTGKYVPPSRRAGAAPEALFTIQAVAAAPSPLTESSSRPYSSGNGNAPGKPDDPAGPSGSNGVRQGQQHSPHLRSQRGWAHGLPEASSIRSRTLRREDLLHHFGHPHDGTLNFFGYLNPVGRSGRNEATMSDKKVNDRPAHLRFKARSEPADATPTSSSTSPSRSPRNGITATREITELPSTTASVDVGTPGDISETIGSMSLSDRPSSPPILPSPHPLAHLVSYIIVFHNAQPAWESDRELWVHTSAEVMTRDCEGQKKNFGRPIPVFQAQGSRQSFEFAEWWSIDRLEVVEPNSETLISMLDAKQSGNSYTRGRTADAWRESLSQQWIKLFLTRPPAASEHYDELRSPLELEGGESSEVEKYMLQVGGLVEEVGMLEGTVGKRREGVRAFERSGSVVRH